MKAGFTIDLAESLTSAVFDELDRQGAESSLPLVRWKLKPSRDGFIVEGLIARDDSHLVGARWAQVLGILAVPEPQPDGSLVWTSESKPWRIVLIGRDDFSLS